MRIKKFVVKKEIEINVVRVSRFISIYENFNADIKLTVNGATYEAKSILGILSAGVKLGDEVTFSCSGPDEVVAIKTIDDYLRMKLK